MKTFIQFLRESVDNANTNIYSDGFYLDLDSKFHYVEDYGQKFSFHFTDDGSGLEVGRGKNKMEVLHIDLTFNRRGSLIGRYFSGANDDFPLNHCTGEAKRITDNLGKLCKPLVMSLVKNGKDSKLVRNKIVHFMDEDYKFKNYGDPSDEEIDQMLKQGKLK